MHVYNHESCTKNNDCGNKRLTFQLQYRFKIYNFIDEKISIFILHFQKVQYAEHRVDSTRGSHVESHAESKLHAFKQKYL